MSSPRLLFFPLPEIGHILPTLEIARHYVGQGFDVVYMTTSSFSDVVCQTGARIESITTVTSTSSAQHIWYTLGCAPYSANRRERVISLLRDYLDANSVDLLLLDRHLSSNYGCDFQSAFPKQPYLYFSTSLPAWKDIRIRDLDKPTLILCPADLEIARFRDRGALVQYVEPSLFRNKQSIIADAATSGLRRLILATWGTQSVRYTRMREILYLLEDLAEKHPELDFVVTNPYKLVTSRPHGRPENLRYTTYVDQATYLRRAAVFFTHGGLGSLKEAIAAAVPMIVLPFYTDQPMNALRISHHGLGSALFPEEQHAANFEENLLLALSGRYDIALRAMQSLFLEVEEGKPSHVLINRSLS